MTSNPQRVLKSFFTEAKPEAMTRSELVGRLAQKYPALTHADLAATVTVILEAITTTLVAGERVEIRGFGSFGINYRPPQIGRNPKTGESVAVPAKYVPHFRAGLELRERVGKTLGSKKS